MNLLADSALLIMVFIHVSKSIIMSYKHFHNEQQIFEVDTHTSGKFHQFLFQGGSDGRLVGDRPKLGDLLSTKNMKSISAKRSQNVFR